MMYSLSTNGLLLERPWKLTLGTGDPGQRIKSTTFQDWLINGETMLEFILS